MFERDEDVECGVSALRYWNAVQPLLTSTKGALPFAREGRETNPTVFPENGRF